MSKHTVSAAGEAMPAQGLKTRRMALAILGGASAFGVRATVARTSGVDPVFAAIERHKAAEAAFVATLNPADTIWARQHGREVADSDLSARDAASLASDDMLSELLETVPTSPAGARAALEYLVAYDDGYHLGSFAPTLLKSPLLAA